MDKIESYRKIIQSFLTAYAAIPIANGSIDCYISTRNKTITR